MTTPGLYHQRAGAAERAAAKRVLAAATDINPHDAYRANDDAFRLAQQCLELDLVIRESEAAVQAIQATLSQLRNSSRKSRLRSLAITDLEQAADRLFRELGVNPGL